MTYRPYSAIIAAASSQQAAIKARLKNSTGFQINKLVPVRANTNGEMAKIDVSVEFQAVNVVGVTSADTPDASFGDVYLSGKIENITGFDFGDTLYINKIGELTSQAIDIGVNGFISGDFVIRVGVVVKNDIAPAQKDLLLSIGVVGQL
jgi:hypothetical protein